MQISKNLINKANFKYLHSFLFFLSPKSYRTDRGFRDVNKNSHNAPSLCSVRLCRFLLTSLPGSVVMPSPTTCTDKLGKPSSQALYRTLTSSCDQDEERFSWGRTCAPPYPLQASDLHVIHRISGVKTVSCSGLSIAREHKSDTVLILDVR